MTLLQFLIIYLAIGFGAMVIFIFSTKDEADWFEHPLADLGVIVITMLGWPGALLIALDGALEDWWKDRG